MGNIVLKVPFFGFVRPFGPMAGLPFKLSDSEADDYEKFSKPLEKINKEDDKARERMKELEERMVGDKFRDNKDASEYYRLRRQLEHNEKTRKTIEREFEAKQAQRAKDLAQQQVSQAMKPVDSINKMKAESDIKLQQQGQEMSQKMQEKEEKQQKFDAAQYDMMSQVNPGLKALNEKVDELKKDKPVIPVPTPVSQPERSATMNASTSFNFITSY